MRLNKKDIKFTEWFRPPKQTGLISMGYIFLKGLATNGKPIRIQIINPIVISELEEQKNNKEQIKELMKIKHECVGLGLQDFIDRISTKRTGVRGYKGYFKLRKLELYASE